jgi:two-component system chemotaxis sensor kinase CheA
MGDFDQFKDIYISECYERLEEMEERLLSLDKDANDLEEINSIFRCAHSIKGGAGAFGFNQITKFTHSLESLLDLMRQGEIKATKEVIDIILTSVDILGKIVKAAQENHELDNELIENVQVKLELITGTVNKKGTNVVGIPSTNNITKEEQVTVYKIDFRPHLDLFLSGNEPLLIIRELKTYGKLEITTDYSQIPSLDLLEVTNCYFSWKFVLESNKTLAQVKEVFEFVDCNCDLAIEEIGAFELSTSHLEQPASETISNFATPVAIKESKDKENHDNKHSNSNVSSIRVDIDKIDKLVNMVGELIITQSMLMTKTKSLTSEQNADIIKGIDELSQHSRDLQEVAMSIRMQPIKTIFSRLPRIVRDLSSELGKNVKIELHGETTEVDKSIIEYLSDPLTHMIRNSVDHGIELPEDRIKTGKSPEGTIKLTASHKGGKIMIQIADDGAGINRAKILNKAIEKGLVKAGVELSPEEIDNLIFLPGFSTAEKVSNISGRGVGMDVVRSNIEMLGGSVNINNSPGNGTVMNVFIPLTLAILDGMVVKVVNESYIIAIASIVETMKFKKNEISKISLNSDVINLRNEFLPVFHLSHIFNINNTKSDINASESDQGFIVLVENGNEKFGLVVDELIGQQQVVIKSLEPNTSSVEGISGATILGDGMVSLILDIDKLSKMSRRKLEAH